jgi:AraC-like DNA-binding protein
VLKALQAADSPAIAPALREFLAASAPSSPTLGQLQQTRGLLTWACEHLTREVAALGAGTEPLNAARERAIQIIMGSSNSISMAEAFRSFVEQMRQQVVQLFSQRDEKIVSETQRLVREIGPDKATIHNIARNLKLSAGHLGRVYSRTAGHTLEEFLIRQKLQMGKRLLLDLRLQVAEVAIVGFNTSYLRLYSRNTCTAHRVTMRGSRSAGALPGRQHSIMDVSLLDLRNA